MQTTSKQLKVALSALKKEGVDLVEMYKQLPFPETKQIDSEKLRINAEAGASTIALPYQNWYTQALPVIRQLIPERYQEFQELYRIDKRREVSNSTYGIHDYLVGLRIQGIYSEYDSAAIFSMKLQTQVSILVSVETRIDSALSDIQGVLQAELFDDELGAAEELFKKGHLRSAGTLAGVTLERHLSSILTNHGFKLARKNLTIADLNAELKKQGVYDLPDSRFIDRLADIRNYCAHPKEREPTKDEVHEMIEGVKKVVKTIF